MSVRNRCGDVAAIGQPGHRLLVESIPSSGSSPSDLTAGALLANGPCATAVVNWQAGLRGAGGPAAARTPLVSGCCHGFHDRAGGSCRWTPASPRSRTYEGREPCSKGPVSKDFEERFAW